MEHKKIKVPCEGAPGGYGYLYADVFAQSAFDNNVTFDDFTASLDNFSAQSRSSEPQINEWRQEATDIFFELLEKAGKLRMDPLHTFNGSDFEDPEGKQVNLPGCDSSEEGETGTTPVSNKNLLS